MARKVKRKKSGIRIFVIFLLMVVIAVLVYKFIITLGNQHISEKEYDDKASSYSSLKITPGSSDDGTRSHRIESPHGHGRIAGACRLQRRAGAARRE